MPNPVKRHSRSRRNTRRAHDFLKQPPMSVCPQ
ncbi:MAG: 50S ribosomal protein L32, partial [Smithella sp.]|nr:50S ribosomal protein L32 [Smithella sp.]